MPTAQRLAIVFTTADQGMMVYDTTLNNLFIWNGTAWVSVPDSGDSSNEQVIFNDNGVLIGDPGLLFNKTTDKLTVAGTLDIWRGLLNQGASTGVGDDTLNTTVVGAAANTAFGYRAASQLTTGTLNTGVGYLALRGFVGTFTGGSNTAVGANAGLQVSSGGSNSFFGKATGGAVTTGSFNVAVGHDALANTAQASTASHNIAIGDTAMFSASPVVGDDNIGIGRSTLIALSSGSDNVVIGRESGSRLTTGSANTYVGAVSAQFNLIGTGNTGIGAGTLNAATVSDLTAVGAYALTANTTGIQNTAVGRSALATMGANSNCTAVGFNAGRNTIASRATAFGSGALELSTGGDCNTAVGYKALGNGILTGGFNTAIGDSAGTSLTTGINNTLIGYNTGANITIGNANICLGMNATCNAISDSNTLAIGSSGQFVATNGGATTYYATATAGAIVPTNFGGYIRIRLNGTFVKVPIYND